MLKRKILIPWVSISFAHKKKELDMTLNAISESLEVYKKALYSNVKKYLIGPAIKPVFRRFN